MGPGGCLPKDLGIHYPAAREKGLTGVFSFISPGSHIPVGFSEEEFARLGRSLAVSFCYFLAKQFNHAIGPLEKPGS